MVVGSARRKSRLGVTLTTGDNRNRLLSIELEQYGMAFRRKGAGQEGTVWLVLCDGLELYQMK